MDFPWIRAPLRRFAFSFPPTFGRRGAHHVGEEFPIIGLIEVDQVVCVAQILLTCCPMYMTVLKWSWLRSVRLHALRLVHALRPHGMDRYRRQFSTQACKPRSQTCFRGGEGAAGYREVPIVLYIDST